MSPHQQPQREAVAAWQAGARRRLGQHHVAVEHEEHVDHEAKHGQAAGHGHGSTVLRRAGKNPTKALARSARRSRTLAPQGGRHWRPEPRDRTLPARGRASPPPGPRRASAQLQQHLRPGDRRLRRRRGPPAASSCATRLRLLLVVEVLARSSAGSSAVGHLGPQEPVLLEKTRRRRPPGSRRGAARQASCCGQGASCAVGPGTEGSPSPSAAPRGYASSSSPGGPPFGSAAGGALAIVGYPGGAFTVAAALGPQCGGLLEGAALYGPPDFENTIGGTSGLSGKAFGITDGVASASWSSEGSVGGWTALLADPGRSSGLSPSSACDQGCNSSSAKAGP